MKHHDAGCIGEDRALKHILDRHMRLVHIADTDHIEIDGMIGSVQIDHAAILSIHLRKSLCHHFCSFIRSCDLLRTVKRLRFGKFQPNLDLL